MKKLCLKIGLSLVVLLASVFLFTNHAKATETISIEQNTYNNAINSDSNYINRQSFTAINNNLSSFSLRIRGNSPIYNYAFNVEIYETASSSNVLYNEQFLKPSLSWDSYEWINFKPTSVVPLDIGTQYTIQIIVVGYPGGYYPGTFLISYNTSDVYAGGENYGNYSAGGDWTFKIYTDRKSVV